MTITVAFNKSNTYHWVSGYARIIDDKLLYNVHTYCTPSLLDISSYFFLLFWPHEHVLEDTISALFWRCDGPLVAHQTDVPGSNLASPTLTLMRSRIIV